MDQELINYFLNNYCKRINENLKQYAYYSNLLIFDNNGTLIDVGRIQNHESISINDASFGYVYKNIEDLINNQKTRIIDLVTPKNEIKINIRRTSYWEDDIITYFISAFHKTQTNSINELINIMKNNSFNRLESQYEFYVIINKELMRINEIYAEGHIKYGNNEIRLSNPENHELTPLSELMQFFNNYRNEFINHLSNNISKLERIIKREQELFPEYKSYAESKAINDNEELKQLINRRNRLQNLENLSNEGTILLEDLESQIKTKIDNYMENLSHGFNYPRLPDNIREYHNLRRTPGNPVKEIINLNETINQLKTLTF